MLLDKKIAVVMPAYNAAKTLEKTYNEIPKDIVDEIIIIDDHSKDETAKIAKRLGLDFYIHKENRGYGASQKACYEIALKKNADIIIMLHPDYQYPPRLIPAMAKLLSSGKFDIVLGSRMLKGHALSGGMPLYKYVSNRIFTFLENMLLGTRLSEFHTGFRGFTKKALLNLPLLENSDDFLFDNQILVQAIYFNYKIGEIASPCIYAKESSTINAARGIIYGLGILATIFKFLLQRFKIAKFAIFDLNGRKLQAQ